MSKKQVALLHIKLDANINKLHINIFFSHVIITKWHVYIFVSHFYTTILVIDSGCIGKGMVVACFEEWVFSGTMASFNINDPLALTFVPMRDINISCRTCLSIIVKFLVGPQKIVTHIDLLKPKRSLNLCTQYIYQNQIAVNMLDCKNS